MPKHEHFEELCSLAVIGDLSPSETQEFFAHVRQCAQCQRSYQEFTELACEHIPVAARHAEFVGDASIQKVRQGALARLMAEGLRLSPDAMRGPVRFRDRVVRRLEDLRWVVFARRIEFAIYGFGAAVLVVAVLLIRYDHAKSSQMEALQGQIATQVRASARLQAELSQARQDGNLVANDAQQLDRELADLRAHSKQLETERAEDLRAIQSLESNLERLTAENRTLAEHAQVSDAEMSKLREQLQPLRNRADSKEAEVVAARYQINELSAQLQAQQTALDQEKRLLAAGRDIRDLIAARNLHIIDVHDTDSHGEARPFGRIFLTDGKELIFYAYDLDSAKLRNAAFQAWGQRTDNRDSAVNLGILLLDDQKQARWALKVEDPNLLSAIDSVFVTVEPHGGANKPTGKKLMYAYLRNPINHP